jgi:DNA primase
MTPVNYKTVDDIKHSVMPLDFYRHELPGAVFKSQAWSCGGLCPFHADNNPGSFRINIETGAFKCFACGKTGGDIISFTMAKYGLSFHDAMANLADSWGLI